MNTKPLTTALKWSAGAAGLTVATYAGYAGLTWLRYGRVCDADGAERDALLDRVLPRYDVVDRHHIHVSAPARVAFAAACETDLNASPLVHAIFKARELVLGSSAEATVRPRGIVAFTQSIGWRVLAERPGCAIVMGSATRPWEADVVFRPLTPEAFATFDEPDAVRIVWTLRAEPDGEDASTLFTETRVATSDASARRKFRRYWALFSPGIRLIRFEMLRAARAEAERRHAGRLAAA